MDIRACKRCKNLFQYVTGRTICPHCLKKEEEMFGKVKDYLREYPGAQMQMVSQATEVPISLIEIFIRAGRLEVSPHSPIGLPCERCGAVIRTGRYCKSCATALQGQLSGVASEMQAAIKAEKEEIKPRMRFLNEERIGKK